MNGMKILKISLIVIVLVALVYFIVGIFMHGDGQTRDNFQKFSRHVAGRTNKSTQGTDKTEVPLDGIVITLGGGKFHYMKADMSLKMKNTDDKKALEKNIQDVRDLILRYTSTQNSDKLITEKGKKEYKDNLKKVIYNTFGYDVLDVYFRNFVLAP
ncbi:MAG: flagellar basal body-associated FliL family protein [Sulfurospirillum sp.]